jgi:hypothetical protein
VAGYRGLEVHTSADKTAHATARPPKLFRLISSHNMARLQMRAEMRHGSPSHVLAVGQRQYLPLPQRYSRMSRYYRGLVSRPYHDRPYSSRFLPLNAVVLVRVGSIHSYRCLGPVQSLVAGLLSDCSFHQHLDTPNAVFPTLSTFLAMQSG